MNSADYILWLPSWYPNKYEPYNGDFIQRHAKATSEFCSIVVCHFPQLGEAQHVKETWQEICEDKGLKEIVFYKTFKPIGLKIIDKIRFNISYYRHALRTLKEYFEQFGPPKIVHVHVPMKAGILALWIRRKYKVNFILSEHYSFYLRTAPNNFFNRSFLFRQQTRKVFIAASSVTTVSQTIAAELKKIFSIKTIKVIRNVVNTSYFNYLPTKKSKFTFVHVSSFSIEKNIGEMLSAFKDLSLLKDNWQLLMIGPFEKHHFDFVTENKLEDFIEFAGEVKYEEVASLMKAAHALVMFSLVENFPCVIIEALCSGIPVVASDVGGISEAINDTNGILVPREDKSRFLDALKRIIEEYQIYDSSKIAEDAASKYSYSVIGKQFFTLYCANSDYKG